MALRMPDPDDLLTTVEAAQAVFVSINAVRNWRNRGWTGLDGTHKKLPVAGHDPAGLPQHRYRDVLAAEREARQARGKSHRRVGPPAPDADSISWATLNLRRAS